MIDDVEALKQIHGRFASAIYRPNGFFGRARGRRIGEGEGEVIYIERLSLSLSFSLLPTRELASSSTLHEQIVIRF